MNREELKSAKYMVENNIKKSLEYDLRDSLVEVKGDKLREQLSAFLVNLILDKNQKFREMDLLIEEIGVPPQCQLDEYETKGFKSRLQTIPYKYSWDMIYPKQPESIIPNNESRNPKADLMDKYNNKLRCYIDLSVDAILVKTIYDSVDEKKIYPIKLEFASKIGL